MVAEESTQTRVVYVGDTADFDRRLTAADGGAFELEVDSVRTAERALELVEERGVDGVVAEYALPDSDGVDLLQRVREFRPDLPFVLFAGEGDEQVAKEAVAADVDGYVPWKEGVETLASELRGELDGPDLDGGSSATSESERRYRSLVDTSPVPINLFDAEGEVVYANQATLDLLDVDDREELVGRSIFEFVAPEDRDAAEAELRQVVEEKVSAGPTRMQVVTEAGDRRDIQVATAPGEFGGEPIGQAVVLDITDIRRTELELRETASRYRNLFEGSPVPMVLVDAEGEILLANDAARDLTGVAALEGMSMLEFVEGENERRSRERLERVIEESERVPRTQMEIHRPDGERRFVQVATAPGQYQGEPVGQVVLTDVTALRETERELRAERRFVENALDAIEDVFYVADTEGNIQRWNERALEVSGYTAEEFEALDIEDLFVAEDVERVVDSMRATIEKDGDVVEARILTKSGETIPYEFRGRRLEDEEGELFGLVGIGRDISEHREYEQQLEEQRELLATLNRTNEVIRDVNAALVTAETRAEIEAAVCEQFAGSGPYRFAWVGGLDRGHQRVVPNTWAGAEKGYLDTLTVTLDESEPTGRGPTARAIRTGEVRTNSVTDPEFEPWREAAEARGYGSVTAIPITYGDATYGVIVVYAADAEEFDGIETPVLAELGRTVGAAINAVERKRAILADPVLELELRISDETEFFGRFAAAVDAPVTLEKVTPVDEDGYTVYLTVETDDVGRVERICDQFRSVEAWSRLADREEGCVLELRVTEPLVVDLLAAHGSALVSLSADPEGCELETELPESADVRSFVETLQRNYREVELLAQRERTERRQPRLGVQLEELLTERQREVLETAYFAGYFEEPRERSGVEIAETLDISGPTFHHHIRSAQRRLLTELLSSHTDGE